MTNASELDPRFAAGVQMIERTGAKDFRIGYSDEDEGKPVVWYAVASYRQVTAGPTVHQGAECAAGLDPLTAVMRLCERLIDGGVCTHCQRPTIFDPDMPTEGVVDEILDAMGCRYKWDIERATFVRSCEGEAD